jgi:hypothetical protein
MTPRIAAATLAGTALIATSCGSSSHALALPGLTARKLAALKLFVSNRVRDYGDAHPSSVMVFATGSNYLVVARGHFVIAGDPLPPGAAPPRGEVLTLTLSQRNLGEQGHGLGDVDTSRLGPGIRLSLSR